MKVLYHECTDYQGNEMPVEFVDGNGKLWVVPFGEPVEFENEYMALKILETLPYMGLVEVKFSKSRSGITYEMEDASERAREILKVEEKKCITEYIKTQLESRVSRNFPPLPPVGRALSCIIKHKIDLVGQGLRVVGWEPPYETPKHDGPITPAGAASEDRLRQLEQQTAQQQILINQLLSARLKSVEEPKEPKKGKPTEITVG